MLQPVKCIELQGEREASQITSNLPHTQMRSQEPSEAKLLERIKNVRR